MKQLLTRTVTFSISDQVWSKLSDADLEQLTDCLATECEELMKDLAAQQAVFVTVEGE